MGIFAVFDFYNKLLPKKTNQSILYLVIWNSFPGVATRLENNSIYEKINVLRGTIAYTN
jgi:hypothetical protein